MDVVDQITKVRTTRQGPHEAVPADPVAIESVTRAVTAALPGGAAPRP